jgi:hypothetical protein
MGPSPNVWGKDHAHFGPLESASLDHHPEVFKCHCLK